MGLPVIATNWSGPTAFLTEENGYPLGYTLVELPDEMRLSGHLWVSVLPRQRISTGSLSAHRPHQAAGHPSRATLV